MSNLCVVNISLYSDDEIALRYLYERITAVIDRGDYDSRWIGTIGQDLGVCAIIDGRVCDLINSEHIRARSSIDDITLEEGKINMVCSSAYSPQLTLYKMIADKFLPGGQFIYSADEVYSTNDESIAGTYIVDVYDENLTSAYANELSKEKAISFLNATLKKEFHSLEELLKYIDEEDIGIGVHEMEYEPVETFCA